MVTRDASCLAKDTFPDKIAKKNFLLLYLSSCLSTVVHSNKYLTRDSKTDVLFITITGNLSVAI